VLQNSHGPTGASHRVLDRGAIRRISKNLSQLRSSAPQSTDQIINRMTRAARVVDPLTELV
jgi:hypothetical protein